MLSALQPVIIFTLLNVAMTIGLYVTAMSGQLSMATAAIAGVGAYLAAVLTVNFDVPFPLAVLAGTIAGGFVGTCLALATLRMRDFIFKLTTLAFGEALTVVAFNWDYIGGANSFYGVPASTNLFVAALTAGFAFFVAFRFDGSRLGFAARAVRDNATAASAMGISVARIRILTFALGSAIIGMAGAVQVHYVLVISPRDLGFFVSLDFVIFLLLGGMQTLWGAILGATILTLLPEALRFTDQLRLIFYGVMIVLVVLVRPQGLLVRKPTGRSDRTKPRPEDEYGKTLQALEQEIARRRPV
jgi:branched-chain amino acid transport system permease protein